MAADGKATGIDPKRMVVIFFVLAALALGVFLEKILALVFTYSRTGILLALLGAGEEPVEVRHEALQEAAGPLRLARVDLEPGVGTQRGTPNNPNRSMRPSVSR